MQLLFWAPFCKWGSSSYSQKWHSWEEVQTKVWVQGLRLQNTLSPVPAARIPASMHAPSPKPNFLFPIFMSAMLFLTLSLWEGDGNRLCMHFLHVVEIRHLLPIQYLCFIHMHLLKVDLGTCRTKETLATTPRQANPHISANSNTNLPFWTLSQV